MSNRVFKKVFGEEDILKHVAPDSEDEVPVLTTSGKKKVVNPYQLLNELSESEAKEGDQEDGGQDGESGDDEGSQKRKKKKRRPKKKRQQSQSAAPDTELEDEEAQKKSKPKKKSPPVWVQISPEEPAQQTAFQKLFKVDPKFLNSEFELKRMFGARVINQERNKPGQRRIYRPCKLIMPKEEWPPVKGSGISMSFLNSIDGQHFFKFDHNIQYRDVQRQFLRAVESLNPDNIVQVLRLHPYHIDSHIQLSDMAKAAEDMAVAADLIEGALHCLENNFNGRFVVTDPSCRMDYRFQENRPFFILLFKHLVFVGQRACHRTALELCKRLLSLDMGDPLGVTLMVDFYALKAEEVGWFVDLYEYWEKSRNMDQLPNFSYSVALAYFLLSRKGGSDADKYAKKADAMIQYAVMMFPSVLLPLLDKLGVQVDPRARGHNYFNSFAQSSQSRSLRLLCELYVWRTHHVWRDPIILPWLERNVSVVLDKVDAKDPIVKDFEEKRKRRYQATTPRNILRHVILTDNKELTFNFPPDLAKEPLLNFDPLPPKDAIDIYSVTKIARGPRNASRAGILTMLLDSLWNDLNAPQAPNVDDADAPPQQQQQEGEQLAEDAPIALGEGLQQSVTALLDAMRDLLTNAGGGRPEGDAADGEDSGTEENAEVD